MTLNQIESKTRFEENGETRRLDTFQIGSYQVKRLTVIKDMKVLYRTISVVSSGEYMPEINYEDGFWTKGKPCFKIQTCAYGAMDVTEIEKAVAGYQKAMEVVKVLTMNFC